MGGRVLIGVGFRVCLITDRRMLAGSSLLPVVEKALQGGVDAVQLREKDLGGRELYRLAVNLRTLTRRHGAGLFINDRIDVALACGADGVQLPGDSFPVRTARELLPAPGLLGVSVHSCSQARLAVAGGADFVVFGPVFDTPSKRQFGAPQGLGRLEKVCRQIKRPVVAVGGISAANASKAMAAGAGAVACISSILGSSDPCRAARSLQAAVS